MSDSDAPTGTEDIQPPPTELATLAFDTLTKLTCYDFASCREAARTVSRLHFGLFREMVERYDPKDERAFADLIAFFSILFNDKREAANVFGISVSTFYRWKSGETVPHILMRGTIRDSIRRFLAERSFDAFEMPPLDLSRVSEARSAPH